MAAVFRARERKHDRLVVVKRLHPERAEAVGSGRFLQEMRITARPNHPHILPLLDSGSADGLIYQVMPFVEGVSLRQRHDRERWPLLVDQVRATGEPRWFRVSHPPRR